MEMQNRKSSGRELEIEAGLRSGGQKERKGRTEKDRKGMKESCIRLFLYNTDVLGVVLGAGYTDVGRMP